MGTMKTSLWLTRRLGALCAVLISSMSACTFVFDAGLKQCDVDADCAERGFARAQCVNEICQEAERDPIWGCLEEGPPATTDTIVPFSLQVRTTGMIPITNATVRACSRLEPVRCLNPLGAPSKVDANGIAKLEVPQDFNGYFEVYGPMGPDVEDPNFVRILVYMPPREIIRGDRGNDSRGVFGFSLEAIQSLAVFVGAAFDSDTGLAVLTALNCAGTAVPSTTFALASESAKTEKTKSFYTFENIPSLDAKETDVAGTGGFTNLVPGPVSFLATANDNGTPRSLTTAQGTSAFTRAGWYTQVYVSP
jgi:hypothetical protein